MKITIYTDLEPDDVVFLMLFLSQVRNETHSIKIVVGEAHPESKYWLCVKWLNLFVSKYKLKGIKFLVERGEPSDKKWNIQNRPGPTMERFNVAENFDDPDVVYCLKPLRELLGSHGDLSNITLYVYGGFNFRTLLFAGESRLLPLLESFKEVHLFEALPILMPVVLDDIREGSNNSADCNKLPKFFERYGKEFPELNELIADWNFHIFKECYQNLINPEKTDVPKNRSREIIHSIADSNGQQFVFADPLVFIGRFYPELMKSSRGAIEFDDNSRTQFTEGDGNIVFYNGIVDWGGIDELLHKFI